MIGTDTAKRLFAVPVLVLALLGAVQAASLFQRDLQFIRNETEVSFWGRGDYQPTDATILRINQGMGVLLHSAPHHPAYLSLQANSYAWQAYWAEGASSTRQYARQAVHYQSAALDSRPAHLQSQARLADYIASQQSAE